MDVLIYSLCSLTALACTVLLMRGYAQARSPLLFWSGLCFAGLTLNNVLVLLDLVVFPTQIDLSTARLVTALASLLLMVYGLVWERD